jgi:HEAT repeats
MKKAVTRLTIFLFLVVTGACLLGPLIQKWPFYRGRSLLWDWGMDLQSDDTGTRSRAAAALTEALSDSSRTVRLGAARAFVIFGRKHRAEIKEIIPALRQALGDKDQEVRDAVKAALRNIDPDDAEKAGVMVN